MMRSYLKYGMAAVALMGLSATIASAGDLGLVLNGDMELVSRFSPHGDPGGDTVNGVPDAWGHSQNTGWSNGTTDPAVSGIHSMLLDDTTAASAFAMEEGRSFELVLPSTSNEGDTLNVHWKWAYDITSNVTGTGDQFSANIRISNVAAGVGNGFDLLAPIDALQTTVLTDAATSSTGGQFVDAWASITLPAGINTFDIIFNTGNRTLDDADPGKLDVTGTLFVDDVSATLTQVPEPASLLLLSIGGLMMMLIGRHQRG